MVSLLSTVGQVNFPKAPDTFSFEEDSSNDALSPEQPRSQESQGSESLLPETKFTESSSPLATTTIQVRRGCFTCKGIFVNYTNNIESQTKHPRLTRHYLAFFTLIVLSSLYIRNVIKLLHYV